MLPAGVKRLDQVKGLADPIARVHDAKRLLEFVLVEMTPDLRGQEGRDVFLSDRVRHLEARFSKVADVMFAIGVRNRLDHPRRGDEPLRADEIERAGQHLIRAIEEVLPHAPGAVAGAARGPRAGAGGSRATSRGAVKAGAKKGARRKGAGGVACPSCQRRFSTRKAQQQHARDAHGQARPRGKRGRPRKRGKARRGLLRSILRWLMGR